MGCSKDKSPLRKKIGFRTDLGQKRVVHSFPQKKAVTAFSSSVSICQNVNLPQTRPQATATDSTMASETSSTAYRPLISSHLEKLIIDEAKKAGADAVKLQTYTPDTITLNCDKEDFQIKGGLWDGQTLFELYQKAYTPWEWHKEIF